MEKTMTCQYFGQCGGCHTQKAQGTAYKAYKQEQLKKELEKQQIQWDAPIEMIEPKSHWGSRQRIGFTVIKEKGELRWGLNALGTNKVIAIERCPLAMDSINQSIPAIKALLEKLVFKRLKVQITKATTGIDVGLIGAISSDENTIFRHVGQWIPKHRIHRLWRQNRASDEPTVIMYTAPLGMEWMGTQVPLSMGAFLQPSPWGEEVLQSFVSAEVKEGERVVELYSGMGTLTIPLAKSSVKSLKAYENNKEMVQSLKAIGIEAVLRDIEKNPLTAEELNRADTLVIDPPRVGARKQLQNIKNTKKIAKIIMVSCNPESFASDGKILIDQGYKLKNLKTLDQFPYTKHLEVLATFGK